MYANENTARDSDFSGTYRRIIQTYRMVPSVQTELFRRIMLRVDQETDKKPDQTGKAGEVAP